MKSCLLVLTVCANLLLVLPSHAVPQPPAAPPTVLNLARAAVRAMTGTAPTGEPKVSADRWPYHENRWVVEWSPSFYARIDHNRVVELSWDAANSWNEDGASRPLTVTREQSIATLVELNRKLGVPPGDWRLYEAEPWSGLVNEKPDEWFVRFLLYVGGWPMDSGGVSAFINGHTGRLTHWRADYGIYIPSQSGRVIKEDLARSIAVAAFQEAGGPEDLEPKLWYGGPSWSQVAPPAPIYRLAYDYEFKVEDGDIFEAIVDAETGELWHLELLTIGATEALPRLGAVKPSARMKLAANLLNEITSAGLGRAITSGTLLKAVKRGSKVHAFRWKVERGPIAFSLDTGARVLAWKAGRAWSGVRLSAAETKRAAAWLRERKL